MITADQLFAHAVGDYVLQTDWMATEKTKRSLAAALHVATYGLPFLLLRPSLLALLVIVGTHFVIDRWRLARYVVWARAWMTSPWSGRPSPFRACAATGFEPDRPAWLAVWLMIIVDNLLHVGINALALRYL